MKFLIKPWKFFTVIFIVFLTSCSSPDISDDQAVMADLQGVWTGYIYTGAIYQHIKLRIDKDSFEGWVQTSDSKTAPEWNSEPNESGLISLSTVQENDGAKGKYRKFAFTCNGRCCGDKSLSLKALADLLSYVDGKGLMAGSDFAMVRIN